MDISMEDLDFDLDFGPAFVISFTRNDHEWFLASMSFKNNTDDTTHRHIFWTTQPDEALTFLDVDDVNAFARSQLGSRRVKVSLVE